MKKRELVETEGRSDTMERHEFDAAYARICEVCGMKTQTELSAYLGIRQSSISDAKRRMMIPAAWLLTLLTREGVNPTWILTGGGSKFLVPASLPPSAPTLLLARLAGPELEQRIRAGADERDGMYRRRHPGSR